MTLPFAVAAVSALVFGLLLGRAIRPPMLTAAPVLWAVLSRLDRAKRGAERLLFRGIAFALLILFGALWLGLKLHDLLVAHIDPHAPLLVGFAFALLPVWRASWHLRAAQQVASGVAAQDGKLLSDALADLDAPSGLTQHTACRFALKRASLSMLHGFIPVFWLLLLGLPGLLAARAILALSHPPEPGGYSPAILRGPLALQEALAIVSSLMVTGVIWLVGPVLPGVSTARLGQAIRHDAAKQGIWTDGAVLAAQAAALDVGLAGQRDGQGAILWIGPGSARVTPAQLRRGVALCGVVCLSLVVLCAGWALLGLY